MCHLENLEINKKIAEIEGVLVISGDGENQNKIYDNYQHSERYGIILHGEYNPIEDDGLCHRLIVKHDLIRQFEPYDCLGWYYTDLENEALPIGKLRECFLVNDHGENKAALLAIVELHKATLQK